MIFYIYLGYPIVAYCFSLILNKKVKKSVIEPSVSILIAAYNEEDVIEGTLKNKLELIYPKEKIEIIVISDGSTDSTDSIVKGFSKYGVKLIRQEPRAGKTAGLNRAVPQTNGEIIVFSDANSQYDVNALIRLIKNFNDPDVGYVTGKMIYVNPDGATIGDGCSAYMKYENLLRRIETGLGSIVGVDGGIDAIRKNLYQPMNHDQLPDFVLPLMVIQQGHRVVYEEDALLQEQALRESSDEYKMRVRVSLRAMWALFDMRKLFKLIPAPNRSFSGSALFAWQLISHKVLRYLCFVFLLTAFFTNIALWPEGGFYRLLFILQCMAYLGAIISSVLEKRGIKSKVLYFLHYFFLLNLASAHAFIKFIRGKKIVTWAPRKG